MPVVTAPSIVTDGRLLVPGWVAVAGEAVTAVGEGLPPAELDAPGPVVQLPDGLLVPGLVDLQLNGAFGHDLAAADTAAWTEVARRLPETGTTAFVPTYITAPVGDLARALRRYAATSPRLAATPGAARSLGVHLEGPFLSVRRRGAHREEHLLDPTPDRVDALLAAGREHVRYVTLAPEREHGLDAVRRLRAAGVLVSVGHSDATYAQTEAAAAAGATLVTHLFNAQRPLHHRDAGVTVAALTDERLVSGLIVDLHHVVPPVVALAFRAAAGRLALVTDAVAAMGMPPGRYELGGEVVDLAPGRPPLRPDGTIAGSALRMDQAIANTVACGIDLVTAVDAATRVPAAAMGRHDLGRIAPGLPADLVWLSDALSARATWVGGRPAWTDPDRIDMIHAHV